MAKKVTGKDSKESRAESKEQIATPPLAGDLEDSQSVRTSFRLSQEGSEALVWLAKSADVKFQDVLIHLAITLLTDQRRRLTGESVESEQASLSDRIIQAANCLDPKARDTSARKTYVLNKLVLRSLNNTAKKYRLPRDLLVDLALKITKAERQAEADTRRKHYEAAMEQIDQLWREAGTLEKRLQELLGEDDPITHRFGVVIVVLMNLSFAIEAYLKEGTPIDPDAM